MINGRDKGCVILIVNICANWAHEVEVFSYVNTYIANNFDNGDCYCCKIFHEYFFYIKFKKWSHFYIL